MLSHPEAVYFTSSICPICCLPVVPSGVDRKKIEESDAVCKKGRLFHQIARLRTWLESAQPGLRKSTSPGKIVKPFSFWISELDHFTEKAAAASSKLVGFLNEVAYQNEVNRDEA